MVTAKVDVSADAVYYRVAPEGVPIDRTDEIDSGTFVDVSESGELVGVEVVGIVRAWPLHDVLQRFSLDDEDRSMLEALHDLAAHQARVTYVPRPILTSA